MPEYSDDDQPVGETPAGTEPADTEPAYHLLLAGDEVQPTRTALELLISDVAHDHQIRELARAVIARLPDTAGLDAQGAGAGAALRREDVTSIPLQPAEMKIVHTAVHLLLDDLQREQADEMHVLHRIIDKLPDEHAIRAISLD
jgi:hypothetical protein